MLDITVVTARSGLKEHGHLLCLGSYHILSVHLLLQTDLARSEEMLSLVERKMPTDRRSSADTKTPLPVQTETAMEFRRQLRVGFQHCKFKMNQITS